MAARLLIARILLAFIVSELDYSSAFPHARSYMYPGNWPAVMKKEGFSFGNRRPLHSIRSLRQSNRKLQSDFQDQLPMANWQNFQGTLKDQRKVHTQNQLSNHQSQSLHQPSAHVAKWNTATSLSQHPLSKPRSFEFNLKIPFTDLSEKNKGTSSAVKGSGFSNGGSEGSDHYFQVQRPTSVQVSSSFNAMSGSDDSSGKDSVTTRGKTAQEVSKPRFQFSLSIPIPPPTPSAKPFSGKDHHANLQIPERVTVVQNSYMDPAKPQPSSTQGGSEWLFSNPPTVQQQLVHQTYEPLQTKYTERISLAVSPGQDGQHPTPTEQIPTEESSVFPGSSASAPPISQYPSYNVHGRYYNAQMNPFGNADEMTQSSQTAPSHPIDSFSQPEKVPSHHYSVGQVKPIGDIYDQTQTGQPAAPATPSFEKYNLHQLNPLLCQNRDSGVLLSPGQPVSPVFAPPQHEPPSSQKPATPHYGADYVAQMGSTDLSSHQYSRYHSGQDALPDRVATFDPAPNIQDVPTDYQAQIIYPAHHANGHQLVQKPEYTKLFVDVEDVRDEGAAQSNYFGAASTHSDGYSGSWTGQNAANAFYSNPRHIPDMPNFASKPRKSFGF